MQRVTLKWFPGWLERKTLVACNNIPKENKITLSSVEREMVGDINIGALRKYWTDMQRIDLVLKDNISKNVNCRANCFRLLVLQEVVENSHVDQS
jgi:hypothetical protein